MRKIAIFATLLILAGYTRGVASTRTELQPDNTVLNQRDQDKNELTADAQARGSKKDVELTRKIRRELTRDDSLSVYAKNVKIITQGGEVILRGPVHSEQEKQKITAAAGKYAGAENVRDQLEIKAKQ